MSQVWRLRSIHLRCLFFTLAVQAITPDAHDLASPNLLKLLCFPADQSMPGESSLPAGDNEQNELLGEVCLPRALQLTMPNRRRESSSSRITFVLCTPRQPSCLVQRRRGGADASTRTFTDLLFFLSRLLC